MRAWAWAWGGLALGLLGCGQGAQGGVAPAGPAPSWGVAGSPVAGEALVAEASPGPLPGGWQEVERCRVGQATFRLVRGPEGWWERWRAWRASRPGEAIQVEPNRALALAEAPLGALPPGGGWAPSVEGPEDEFLAQQWGLWRTQAPRLWPRGRGAGVRVAIVDTGVWPQHPEFGSRVALGVDCTFDRGWWGRRKDRDGALDDHGHGTHVAGLIGAGLGAGMGMTGVAPEASLLAIKALDAQGRGSQWQVLKGVAAAVAAGAKVVNLSLGGPLASSVERRFYEAVLASGVLVVAAAGNEGDAVAYPAAYPGVLAVGALDQGGGLATFSNRGQALGLVASGVGALSTTRGGDYALRSGTSAAAPLVAGGAALLWSLHPEWSMERLRAALLAGARDLGASGVDPVFGHGELDLVGAEAAGLAFRGQALAAPASPGGAVR